MFGFFERLRGMEAKWICIALAVMWAFYGIAMSVESAYKVRVCPHCGKVVNSATAEQP